MARTADKKKRNTHPAQKIMSTMSAADIRRILK
jgi:hypothetical protein